MKRTRRQRKAGRQKRPYGVWAMLIVGAAFILTAAVWSLSDSQISSEDINPADPQQVALGAQVYEKQCASCHGPDLEGEPGWQEPSPDGVLKAPPHDETGHTWHHDDATLITAVKEGGARLPANVGVSPMPAYDDILSDEEIAAVLAYIKSTWPEDILAMQPGR